MKKMKKIVGFFSGELVPDGAVFISSREVGGMMYSEWCHYFLVDENFVKEDKKKD